MQNDAFILSLDHKKEFLSIKHFKQINLKTLEITERDKFDYFLLFSDVEYVNKSREIEYIRKILGYNLTGEVFA